MRGSDDQIREMKSFQMLFNSSEGKLMLEQTLGTTEDVEIHNEVLDDMIRDEEKCKNNNFNIISSIFLFRFVDSKRVW